MQNTDLSIDKLKEMVDEVIKLDITPNKRYKDKYIVAMTPEEKAFNNTTSVAFRIGKNECTSLEATRLHIRYNMVSLMFPVWSLLYYMDSDEEKIFFLPCQPLLISSRKQLNFTTISLIMILANLAKAIMT